MNNCLLLPKVFFNDFEASCDVDAVFGNWWGGLKDSEFRICQPCVSAMDCGPDAQWYLLLAAEEEKTESLFIHPKTA